MGCSSSVRIRGRFFYFKAFPQRGGGGPAGPDEGRVCRGFPFMGYNGKLAPHQSAGGAADSFPRGGKPFYLQSLPSRGVKVAPQGRMRGEFAAASRLWGIMANLPLISQRAGPLTASPEGEAFLYQSGSSCSSIPVAAPTAQSRPVMKRFCFQLGLTRQSTARPTPAPAVRPANRLPKLMAPCT